MDSSGEKIKALKALLFIINGPAEELGLLFRIWEIDWLDSEKRLVIAKQLQIQRLNWVTNSWSENSELKSKQIIVAKKTCIVPFWNVLRMMEKNTKQNFII